MKKTTDRALPFTFLFLGFGKERSFDKLLWRIFLTYRITFITLNQFPIPPLLQRSFINRQFPPLYIIQSSITVCTRCCHHLKIKERDKNWYLGHFFLNDTCEIGKMFREINEILKLVYRLEILKFCSYLCRWQVSKAFYAFYTINLRFLTVIFIRFNNT